MNGTSPPDSAAAVPPLSGAGDGSLAVTAPVTRVREIVTSGAIFFVVFPCVIVVHEFCHLLVALSMGLDAHLHWNRVTWVPPGPWVPMEDLRIWIMISGPLVELVLWIVGSTFLIVLRKGDTTKPVTAVEWFATVGALCSMRWFKTSAEVVLFGRMPDEAVISSLLGWPPPMLSLILLPMALVTVYLVFRLHPPGGRIVPLFLAILFGLLGIAIWIFQLGPVMLS